MIKSKIDNLSKEQLTELRVAFNIFDVDHSGDISTTEYKNVVDKLGLRPRMKQYMELFGDENHKMNFEEFKLKMKDYFYPEKHSFTNITDAFKYFDINKSGMISVEELEFILNKFCDYSKETIESIMQRADKDQNEFISFEEFEKLLSE